jgi:hypothetical protein
VFLCPAVQGRPRRYTCHTSSGASRAGKQENLTAPCVHSLPETSLAHAPFNFPEPRFGSLGPSAQTVLPRAAAMGHRPWPAWEWAPPARRLGHPAGVSATLVSCRHGSRTAYRGAWEPCSTLRGVPSPPGGNASAPRLPGAATMADSVRAQRGF